MAGNGRTVRRARTVGHRIGRVNGFLTAASGRRLGDAAAESAFFLAVAILPMLLTTTAVLRAVRPVLGRDALPGVTRGLSSVLRVVLTSSGSAAADAAQRLLTDTAKGLLTLGTVASITLVTRAMRSLLTGLSEINFGVDDHDERGRAGPRTWLLAVGFAVLAVVLIAAITSMIAVGPLFGYSDRLSSQIATPVKVAWTILRFPLGVVAVFAFVLLLHRTGTGPRPAQVPRRRWRVAATAGAGTTTVGAAAASLLLPLYVSVARSVSPTLGVLGGGLILLVWSYLLAYAVLVGAQIRVVVLRKG